MTTEAQRDGDGREADALRARRVCDGWDIVVQHPELGRLVVHCLAEPSDPQAAVDVVVARMLAEREEEEAWEIVGE